MGEWWGEDGGKRYLLHRRAHFKSTLYVGQNQFLRLHVRCESCLTIGCGGCSTYNGTDSVQFYQKLTMGKLSVASFGSPNFHKLGLRQFKDDSNNEGSGGALHCWRRYIKILLSFSIYIIALNYCLPLEICWVDTF